MHPVPNLADSLRTLEAVKDVPVAEWSGPRLWWRGPLDVEGLAIGSVQAAATALNALTGTSAYSVPSAGTAAAFDSLRHLRIAGKQPEGFAPLSGFRPTSDGWVRLHANYPHHAARLLQALCVSSTADVGPALRELTASEAESVITAKGGVAAAVRTRAEWTRSPMHQAASRGPWIALRESGGSSGERRWVPGGDAARPLKGLRVLDLTRVIAGPTATRLLAALGADVLRIDPPGLPELPDAFLDCGFDKRSVVADFSVPSVLDEVRAVVARADVVVTGYRSGSLERFGLGTGDLARDNGGLVVATLNAWGAGPWQERRGFDSIVQAACGIAADYGSDGDAGWRPGALPVQALDHATGYGLAAAILGLLAERTRTGRGGVATMSLVRTAEELFGAGLLPAQVPGHKPASLPEPLPEPGYHGMESVHGHLRFVGPPLLADGVPVSYTRAPVAYGSSQLLWGKA
ncbi:MULTISPECIES: CoA transferase [Paenarthrobacter]|uniref:CoA transferase n=1 Tax=Paenarthrobacter ureafaciens TaxID=37931 RepID=A0AAX3EQS9_PAEUR|nr:MULTISPECIES: CoA transferase [Paenarthrobacter]NKR11635.1 acyl-CoA thioesterase [Arthrobacter sp. M5]NKR15699.1 acyl-CoA thioesterase [Arthrobacter sp. M6]OEH63509.1 acyl-CoA thioesterase [Arthrobacter sp. D2]OEH65149.1 acyl-CoA thioesterase [Arthrobacter sp. D4]MDO5864633.1 CoA transferase [Paenarthrobacter sp. SD-2]